MSDSDSPQDEVVHLSDSMAEWHSRNLTLPPVIVRQCDSVRNHGLVEGAWA